MPDWDEESPKLRQNLRAVLRSIREAAQQRAAEARKRAVASIKRYFAENGIEAGEDVFYDPTFENEKYPMPSMPEGVREGILKGLFRLLVSLALQHVPALFGQINNRFSGI